MRFYPSAVRLPDKRLKYTPCKINHRSPDRPGTRLPLKHPGNSKLQEFMPYPAYIFIYDGDHLHPLVGWKPLQICNNLQVSEEIPVAADDNIRGPTSVEP